MENQESILAWALRNQKVLNLQIKNLTWISSFVEGWSDLEVSINLSGKLWVGRGTAESFSLAMVKALSESLERFAGYSVGWTSSNGIAAHEESSRAETNAIAELLERDAFLGHFYSGLPLTLIDKESGLLSETMARAQQRILTAGISVRMFRARSAWPYHIGGCYFEGLASKNHPFGVIVGLGSATNLTEALQKAFVEGLRNTAWVLKTRPQPLSMMAFRSLDAPGPFDHRMMALHTGYNEFLPKLVESNFHSESLDQLCVETTLVEIADVPLKIARSDSANIQQMFFGVPSFEKLNYDRLWTFGVGEKNLPKFQIPHPIG